MRHLAHDLRLLLAAGGLLLAVVLMAVFSLLRRPPDPDEIERKRRAHLNQIGRICEGQIVELVEQSPGEPNGRRGLGLSRRSAADSRRRKLVCYSYSISGVTYQTAQDITGLEERIFLNRVVSGQSASIKYDAANPSNSILLAEDWSGLR
ncbi:MAG: hypothetical protein ABSF92_10905 [Candidatus Acidiferrales bacterium]